MQDFLRTFFKMDKEMRCFACHVPVDLRHTTAAKSKPIKKSGRCETFTCMSGKFQFYLFLYGAKVKVEAIYEQFEKFVICHVWIF